MLISELVYMVLDEIKAHSDDSEVTEEHVLFLLNKYRNYLLKKQYLSKTDNIPSLSNTQMVCLNLEDYTPFDDDCLGTSRKSTTKVPNLLFEGSAKIYPKDFSLGIRFALVPKERFPFVGHNKYMQSIIYCYIGDDHYLYFDSSRPQTQYLQQITISGVFEDIEEAAKLSCDNEGTTCDVMQQKFPIEGALVPELIQAVVKELLGVLYRPSDTLNNSSDDLATMASYLARNVKSDLAKQIDGTT